MKILVFDTETTGLDPRTDDIVEFGAVAFDEDGNELRSSNTLIRATKPMPDEAYRVHGISDAMLRAEGKKWREVAPGILNWLSAADVWCGQNLQFDYDFLDEAFARIGLDMPKKPIVDTLQIARRFVPYRVSRYKKLSALTSVFGVSLQDAHRAVHDARATGQLLFAMSSKLDLTVQELISYDATCIGKLGWELDPFEALIDGCSLIREGRS